jgi:hypothetical protein
MATAITSANTNSISGGERVLVRDSDGVYYTVVVDDTDDKIEVWKSADGSSWAQQDAGNSPTGADSEAVAAAIDSSDVIHIVWWDAGVGLRYQTFDTNVSTPPTPTFVAAGAIAQDTSGAVSITPTMPAHVANDILIVQAYSDVGVDMTTATSGWTEIAEVNGDDNFNWRWKRATGA